MLGDQIYADQPSPALQERIAARGDRPAAPDDLPAEDDLPTLVSRRVTRRSIVKRNALSALIPLRRRELRRRSGPSN